MRRGVNAGAAMRDAEDADESAISDAVRKVSSRVGGGLLLSCVWVAERSPPQRLVRHGDHLGVQMRVVGAECLDADAKCSPPIAEVRRLMEEEHSQVKIHQKLTAVQPTRAVT